MPAETAEDRLTKAALTENPPGRSESGYWDRCVCGAHRGAHGRFPHEHTSGDGWATREKPCRRFCVAPPSPKSPMAGGYYPPKQRRRKRMPDRFLEALRAETTTDRLNRRGPVDRRLL